ncbi:MAG: response regulator, partial [Candidatus Rokuibacteriota bacterium]
RLARRQRPRLITLDPELPRMNGWEVVQTIKADPDLQSIPVVVVADAAVDRKGLRRGAVDVVEQPITREALVKALRGRVEPPLGAVLVVEDDEATRTLLTGYLAGEVGDVQTATSGREALDALERFTPDLIVLDLTMPALDGVRFLAMLGKHPRHARLPVLVVTAKHAEDTLIVLGQGEGLEHTLEEITRGSADPAGRGGRRRGD